jgi:hypothetical protein
LLNSLPDRSPCGGHLRAAALEGLVSSYTYGREGVRMKLAVQMGMVLCLLVAVGAWAQEGGTIRGTVYVAGNEPLPEAQVVVVGTDLVATTNAEGRFELRSVPPARQELRISFPGYRDSTRSVTVVAGQVVSLEADLELDEQFGEEIVVTGSKFGEKRLESPVSVETVGAKTIQQVGGVSYRRRWR